MNNKIKLKSIIVTIAIIFTFLSMSNDIFAMNAKTTEKILMNRSKFSNIDFLLSYGNSYLQKSFDSLNSSRCVHLTNVQLPLVQSVQENNYYCVPACLQMVLRFKNINKTQQELANEMNTVPVTGTEYIDLARVANKYLFNDESVEMNEAGYHIQTLTQYDTNPQIAIDFENRVRLDISTNDPIFVAVDVSELYPNLGHGNHMIIITGYALYEGTNNIAYYYYIDPSYMVQDDVNGGLKTVTKEILNEAIINNVEPAYIY